MNVASLKVTRIFPEGGAEEKEVLVVREARLAVFVNGTKFADLVCTPTCLHELVAGRLLTSGVIEEKTEISEIQFCQSQRRAFVTLSHEVSFADCNAPEPTCCTGNRQFLSPADSEDLPCLEKASWKKEDVFALAREFAKGSVVHTHTAGTHSCILAVDGKPVFIAEDISRHNALDKAVGYMLLHDIPSRNAMLFTSGRVPVDMVEKVIRARIPVLVSKSVPTAESAELAKAHGLTLISRAWSDSFELVG